MSITITNSKVSYGSSIVTDGLVGYWDAANPDSYPGSGTIWYDLSGNNYDWSISTASYSLENNGVINYTFDASSRSAGSEWLNDSECTIDCWFYPTTGGSI